MLEEVIKVILEVPDTLVTATVTVSGVIIAAGGFTGAAVIAGKGVASFLKELDSAFDAIASRRK